VFNDLFVGISNTKYTDSNIESNKIHSETVLMNKETTVVTKSKTPSNDTTEVSDTTKTYTQSDVTVNPHKDIYRRTECPFKSQTTMLHNAKVQDDFCRTLTSHEDDYKVNFDALLYKDNISCMTSKGVVERLKFQGFDEFTKKCTKREKVNLGPIQVLFRSVFKSLTKHFVKQDECTNSKVSIEPQVNSWADLRVSSECFS